MYVVEGGKLLNLRETSSRSKKGGKFLQGPEIWVHKMGKLAGWHTNFNLKYKCTFNYGRFKSYDLLQVPNKS
jgi:hypothetical protein